MWLKWQKLCVSEYLLHQTYSVVWVGFLSAGHITRDSHMLGTCAITEEQANHIFLVHRGEACLSRVITLWHPPAGPVVPSLSRMDSPRFREQTVLVTGGGGYFGFRSVHLRNTLMEFFYWIVFDSHVYAHVHVYIVLRQRELWCSLLRLEIWKKKQKNRFIPLQETLFLKPVNWGLMTIHVTKDDILKDNCIHFFFFLITVTK